MGRPRGYDVEEVLRRAAVQFCGHGYDGTSMEDLVTFLGVHRGSLYSAFGSKKGLFLRALDQYWTASVAPLRVGLEALASVPGPVLPALEQVLSPDAGTAEDEQGLLLLVRTAVEHGAGDADDPVVARLDRWLAELTELVAAALERAADLGELRPGAVPGSLAGPLLTAALGLHLHPRGSPATSVGGGHLHALLALARREHAVRSTAPIPYSRRVR